MKEQICGRSLNESDAESEMTRFRAMPTGPGEVVVYCIGGVVSNSATASYEALLPGTQCVIVLIICRLSADLLLSCVLIFSPSSRYTNPVS